MRNLHKQNILELLETLKQATVELKKQTSESRNAFIDEILEFISGIVDFLSAVGAKESKITEQFAAFSKFLSDTKNKSGNIDHTKIKEQVYQLKYETNKIQPDKIEVVFCCYESSMSDCFESVYFEAESDPQCDAYFIPIPYFDRAQNGSLVNMKLNNVADYSAKYKLIDYRKYDFNERKPDVIFIINPYDEQNKITSVHPNFYAKKLQHYTDLLVYIPYFVTKDDIMEHFIFYPGIKYANKVIVQSEKQRDKYISVFKRFAKEFGEENRYGSIEEKTVALGNPKFDKVIHSKKEDFTLPEKWRNVIFNADGTQKKIILYNTTISKLWKTKELYLKKLKSVFAVFKNRDDIVLWWRPHPLVSSTIQAACPELENDYAEIVKDYIEGGWGIYDDTADLHRALAWSNAYYGDRSSLISLYGTKGKPMLLETGQKTLNKTKNEQGDNLISQKLQKIEESSITLSELVLIEHIDISLLSYIDYVVKEDKILSTIGAKYTELQLKATTNSDGSSGQKILKYCKKLLVKMIGLQV